MSNIVEIKVKSPDYGYVELNVERVIAVSPYRRMLLFENIYWELDEENFDKVYEVWKRL